MGVYLFNELSNLLGIVPSILQGAQRKHLESDKSCF